MGRWSEPYTSCRIQLSYTRQRVAGAVRAGAGLPSVPCCCSPSAPGGGSTLGLTSPGGMREEEVRK